MQSLRILLSSVVIAAAVFALGVRFVDRVPLPLMIPHPQSADGVDAHAPSESDGSPAESQEGDAASDPFQAAAPMRLKGIDADGRLHRCGESDGCRAIVVVFLGTECPIANASIPRLNELCAAYRQQGVEFYGVISSPSLQRRVVRQYVSDFAITFPVLFDVTGELRHQLQATHSPHAFVLTPLGRVLYRGAIDDQFAAIGKKRTAPTHSFVKSALDRVLDGERLSHEPAADVAAEFQSHEPVGCLLEPWPEVEEITFNRQVGSLLFAHCTTCHRSGAVAPFSLEHFEEARRHAAQIRVMVSLGEMPPWRPNRGFGHFRGELVLTPRERDLIVSWIDAGCPEGTRDEAPTAPQFAEGWQLGKPDLVLEVPEPFAIPADGPDIYQYFVLPTELADDGLVSAIEYRPGNPRVVHHASFRFDDAQQARALDAAFPGPGYQRFGGWGFQTGGTLGGWALGVFPQRFPADFGRTLRAHSDFVLQTHYHPSGKPETDQASVGIYFAPRTATRQIGELIIANTQLRIPPGEPRFVHRTTYTLPVDTTLHSVLPHTHLLGRETKAIAKLPDGQHVPLIHISDWRFNWQGQYFFHQPLRMPSGTEIHFEVVFDNSDQNPLNPHLPARWVHWGEATSDEMAVCYFDVSTDTPEQLADLLRHNRAQLQTP
jgi:hypothetical protein